MSASGSDNEVPLPRSLINSGGESFAAELASLSASLDALSNPQREIYRDINAKAIADHSAARLLIVAGPGSGKSFLFLARIKHWLPIDFTSSIYVSSFVRKLVKDLRDDVDREFSEGDRERVTVTTLHGLARSLLERSHGTAGQPLAPHISVITEEWKSMVWSDVRAFHSGLSSAHSAKALEKQFYTEVYDQDPQWVELRSTYSLLTQFYNAVGFADMVVQAREAVDEKPSLSSHLFWIVDEYQDFNAAEDHLIRSLTAVATGVLMAGDDEQALYQQLKASLPEIIVSYYDDPNFANAMLPFCSRCSYHVCQAASAFIAHARVPNTIKKIYLPLVVNQSAPKVRIVATSAPVSAVDYIQRFLSNHQAEFDAHVARMEAGEEGDPFLLVLTPQRTARFYSTGGADERLRRWLSQWSIISTGRSADYRRVATFYSVAQDATNNLLLRKVLHYEGVTADQVHPLLEEALRAGCPLSSVASDLVTQALAKCAAVAGVIETDEPTADQVARISAVTSISNTPLLISELDADPLGGAVFGAEDEAEEAIETAGAAAAVEMLTIVGSKGLSAKHVIVIGCDDVNMAHTSRLAFFVALTRARESLHLITSLKAGGSTTAHSFVRELPTACCEYVIYKKTGSVTEQLRDGDEWLRRIAQWSRISRNHR